MIRSHRGRAAQCGIAFTAAYAVLSGMPQAPHHGVAKVDVTHLSRILTSEIRSLNIGASWPRMGITHRRRTRKLQKEVFRADMEARRGAGRRAWSGPA